ncbi:MAG TPA: hypothetical protein VF520_10635 [Thermoleophilaceae bacterium]|jgi:hypothetical protein
MFLAILICSDDECTEVFEAYGPLEELEALACDCGCALEVISVSESHDRPEAPDRNGRFELVPIG